MSTAIEESDFTGGGLEQIVVNMRPIMKLSDKRFFEFCQANRDLRIERNRQGELIIMAPTGSETGNKELDIASQLQVWAKLDGTGKAFGPSAGFRLPNGAVRSSDAAWVRLARWKKLTAKQRKEFAPLCPDFVIELRSETDRLRTLKEKMEEYIDNGAEMGLLIDRIKRQVHVYRRGRKAKVLDEPESVSCEPALPGFALDMNDVW
jgi:Uma2 family endonuclease